MSTRRHMDSDSESDDDQPWRAAPDTPPPAPPPPTARATPPRPRAQADGARLTLHHGFGARIETIRDAVHFVSDQALLYPVGRYIALHDTQNQLQTLVYEQPAAVQQTTALAISPNLKYLAVCEYVSGEGSALGRSQVTVLFLPTRRLMKILYHTTVEGQIGCATFSHDSKLIACQLGGSESTTTVWHWEKAKLVGSFRSRAPISRIRFNPEQSAVLSLSHPLRILRLNDKGSFKDVELPSMRKLGGVEVQEHLWLSSSRLIVLTADGLAAQYLHTHVFASGEYAYATKWWSPQLNASNLATPPKPSGNLSSDLSAEQSGGGLGTVAEGERGGVGAAPDSTTSGGKPARTLTIPGTDSKMLLANDEFDDLPLTPTSSARMAAAEAERPPCAVTCVRECAQVF
ncbi:hypothetical protein T492DRAFT_835675 [Pavlovales sp. CCMP2436]|nr:hypothetical protein T492DRAFT_835675 [Pavlovales sp. CCMP2436]